MIQLKQETEKDVRTDGPNKKDLESSEDTNKESLDAAKVLENTSVSSEETSIEKKKEQRNCEAEPTEETKMKVIENISFENKSSNVRNESASQINENKNIENVELAET